ncbi:efflux RND transporter periplasmic adaptor subunit [bacterium]|nr:efflux RND transporter periplasmic adaptor subunit [bacterium]
MKKKTLLIIGAVIVVIVLVILNFTNKGESGTKVRAAEVTNRELVELVSASGRIQPQTKVDITAQITNEIIALMVREGDRVERGQLLVVLDTVQVKSDVNQARYSVNEISARLDGAKASLDQAQEEYERQQRLYEANLTSETAYKNSLYAFQNAKATFEALKASSMQAESLYEKQLDNLSKCKITAPMSGVITYLDAEVGEIAAAQTGFTAGKVLMTIANLDVFEVEVEVDETEIAKVELGQDANIEVDAFPDTVFIGKVVEIGNTAITSLTSSTDQSTNFRVKVIFEETRAKIRPGMSATVDITTAKRDQVATVPFASIVMRSLDLDSLEQARANEDTAEESTNVVHAAEAGDSARATDDEEKEREDIKGVFVIRDGKARFIPVETGIADQRYIEVTSGLEPGDSVVSGPYRVLRSVNDGDPVIPEKDNLGGGDM